MKPSVGRIVLLVLTAAIAEQINRRRTTGESIADRIPFGAWHPGTQAHVGNEAHEGDIVPVVVVRVWDNDRINGQALLDGNDTFWVTSADPSEEPKAGCWHWPPRV